MHCRSKPDSISLSLFYGLLCGLFRRFRQLLGLNARLGNALKQLIGGLVVWVLRHQLTAEGVGQNALREVDGHVAQLVDLLL